jgi:hypothetical protein
MPPNAAGRALFTLTSLAALLVGLAALLLVGYNCDAEVTLYTNLFGQTDYDEKDILARHLRRG